MELVTQKTVYFTKLSGRREVIKELVRLAASKNKLNEEEIFKAVWQREEQVATGIGNYIAIPHAKVDIDRPIISVAVSKEGINFEAPDGLSARIICLILTPSDKYELQLQLLADTASKFKVKKTVEELIKSENVEEFISMLKQI